jgi:hypothetical protein
VGIGEAHPFTGDAINPRGGEVLIVHVAGSFSIALVVRHDQNDIRAGRIGDR